MDAKWLQRWMILVGCVQSLAIVAVFLPRDSMNAMSILLRVGEMGSTPLPGYLARLSSALYVVHGITLIVIASDLPRSQPIVTPLGFVTVCFGMMMLWIDVAEEMPIWWTALEVIAVSFGGLVLIVLNQMTRKKL